MTDQHADIVIDDALLNHGATRITAATRRAPERRGQSRRP
jgi:hypothetical protein